MRLPGDYEQRHGTCSVGWRMQTLLLLSVLIATFVIPVALLRRHDTGYAPVLSRFAMFVAVYVVLLLYVYPRLF